MIITLRLKLLSVTCLIDNSLARDVLVLNARVTMSLTISTLPPPAK